VDCGLEIDDRWIVDGGLKIVASAFRRTQSLLHNHNPAIISPQSSLNA
jgi:hypothetical protein